MMLTARKTLGLAVTAEAIVAVEVVASTGRYRLVRSAELPLPDDALQAPTALAGALKDLLRRNHFSASRCIIGLAASHVAR